MGFAWTRLPISLQMVVLFIIMAWLGCLAGCLSAWSLVAIIAIAVGTVLYLFLRLTYFHPMFRPGYRMFLQVSPWRPSLPLPLESPCLRLYDFVAMILLGGSFYLMLQLTFPVRELINLSALGWTLVVAIAFRIIGVAMYAIRGGPGLYGYCLVWALLLQLSLFGSLVPFLAGLAFTLATSELVLKLNLLAYPWPHVSLGSILFVPETVRRYRLLWELPEKTGLPFVAIAPGAIKPGYVSTASAVYIAVTSMLLQITFHRSVNLSGLALAVYGAQVVFVVAGRLFVYFRFVRMPTSLISRVARRQWLEPKFDLALAVPLLCFLLGTGGLWCLHKIGLPMIVSQSLLLGPIWLFGLKGRPSYRAWLFTGKHRAHREPSFVTESSKYQSSPIPRQPLTAGGSLPVRLRV